MGCGRGQVRLGRCCGQLDDFQVSFMDFFLLLFLFFDEEVSFMDVKAGVLSLKTILVLSFEKGGLTFLGITTSTCDSRVQASGLAWS